MKRIVPTVTRAVLSDDTSPAVDLLFESEYLRLSEATIVVFESVRDNADDLIG